MHRSCPQSSPSMMSALLHSYIISLLHALLISLSVSLCMTLNIVTSNIPFLSSCFERYKVHQDCPRWGRICGDGINHQCIGAEHVWIPSTLLFRNLSANTLQVHLGGAGCFCIAQHLYESYQFHCISFRFDIGIHVGIGSGYIGHTLCPILFRSYVSVNPSPPHTHTLGR